MYGLWLLRMPCVLVPGLRGLYFALLARLVRGTQLFDRDHYLDAHVDVAASGMPPLRHYVAYGDREGRTPMALFDPLYYRSRTRGRTKHVNALLHYWLVGRYRRISPSPWFDVHYYLSQNKDVLRSGVEPIYHYLRWGGLEGRSPNPQFDGTYYLRTYPQVASARLNPLLHYLSEGRWYESPTRPGMGMAVSHHTPDDPAVDVSNPELWAELPRRGQIDADAVDVVIPVYRDRILTLRSIYSVLRSNCQRSFELVVINDASPDADLVADLCRLADLGLFTLLHNSSNAGFVATVNRGMALHASRDVVLLNADTEVYNDWLDRLAGAACRRAETASVTPLSNNATICSYPRFRHDSPYPLEISYQDLDALAASVNAGMDVEAPTGVGFCMYLRRPALDRIGLFDAKTFGRGYGEENDWCQRALAAGFHNLLAADVFFRHFGNASFQGEKAVRVAAAMKVMGKLHPDYHKSVERFILADPLAKARENLDWARLKVRRATDNVLIACHNRGGGAERHVQEDTRLMREQGVGVYYLRPERGIPTQVRLGHPDCRQLLNLPKFEMSDTAKLAAALRDLGITRLHSHGLVDFAADAPEHFLALAQALGVPFDIDVHDYKVICPRLNLADGDGMYCGEPGGAACDQCLKRFGNDFGETSIAAWRMRHHPVLKQARNIWVPDADVSTRLNRYYPDVTFRVMPHDEVRAKAGRLRKPEIGPDNDLHVVVVGAISKIKGYNTLLECARLVKKNRLPLRFSVMGYSHSDRALELAGVTVTGRYLDGEAREVLHALLPHVVWLPSTWPETYSYTLSLAMRAGYPVFAFDLGAIARRLADASWPGERLPLQMARDPGAIVDTFLKYRERAISSSESVTAA